MNHQKKYLLRQITALCLVFSAPSLSFCAMQKYIIPKTAMRRPPHVPGDLFIKPIRATQILNGQSVSMLRKHYQYPLEIPLIPGNFLIDVWATSRDEKSVKADCQDTAKEDVPHKSPSPSLSKEEYWRTNRLLARKCQKSDDWCLHGHPQVRGTFPSGLPLSLLADKKEGDILALVIHGAPVQLRCKQNGYRYGSHQSGYNFEQMLTYVIGANLFLNEKISRFKSLRVEQVKKATALRLALQKAEAPEDGEESKKGEKDDGEECAAL